jgi:serine/threonine protein kinase
MLHSNVTNLSKLKFSSNFSAPNILQLADIGSKMNWIIGREFKRGIYGPVYIAMNKETGELVTAERLSCKADKSASESYAQQLIEPVKEAQLSNAVPYLGCVELDGGLYVLRGDGSSGPATIQKYLESYGPTSEALAKYIVRQVAIGLKELSQHRFQGAYFTLSTILISDDGTILLEPQVMEYKVQPFVAASSELAMLPELVLGIDDKSRSNVWLLGTLTIALLSGLTWTSLSLDTIASKLQESSFTFSELFPDALVSKISKEAFAFLQRCLKLLVNLSGLVVLIANPEIGSQKTGQIFHNFSKIHSCKV